jgi:hypothetical protein
MSRLPPRGRLKAVAVDFVRLLSSPSTWKDFLLLPVTTTMKTTLLVPVVAALALCTASVQGAPVITTPAAAQRPGTKLVDIDYNLTGTTNPVIIALEISADGGTTWAVPVTAVTGAVGANVTPGNGLRITWDAGVDWNNKLSPEMQFRLKGSELLPEQREE